MAQESLTYFRSYCHVQMLGPVISCHRVLRFDVSVRSLVTESKRGAGWRDVIRFGSAIFISSSQEYSGQRAGRVCRLSHTAEKQKD